MKKSPFIVRRLIQANPSNAVELLVSHHSTLLEANISFDCALCDARNLDFISVEICRLCENESDYEPIVHCDLHFEYID